MKNTIFIVIALLIGGALAWAQAPSVIGSWEGESKCMIPSSPCHDEHALYRIEPDKKNPDQLNADGYKIVDGKPEFMGKLTCRFSKKDLLLSCTANTARQDDWEFHLLGDTLTGTLRLDGGKTLYRQISVKRVAPKTD